MIDLKPYAQFIEYTIKPLVDDTRELMDIATDHGIKLKDMVNKAVFLFVFDKIVSIALSITITGMICLTAFIILSHSSPITQ